MKEKINWKALAAELKAELGSARVEVALSQDGIGIELYPAAGSCSSAFCYTEAVVDFCRAKRLRNYASFRERNGQMVCYMCIL